MANKIFVSSSLKMFVMTLVLILVVPTSAFAEWRNLQLINNSEKDIWNVYICVRGVSGEFGDLLRTDILKRGESINIRYNGYSEDWVTYDIKVVFEDKSHWVWSGIKLGNFSEMTITADGKARFK